MPRSAPAAKKIPVVPLAAGAAVVVILIAAIAYFGRPQSTSGERPGEFSEARAYLPNLSLAGVSMQATENFMKQQVVEVTGKLTNNGPRALRSVDVYCLFYGVDGHELRRERVPIVQSKTTPMRSGETRAFRLPFDTVPEGWNQAIPKLVIASIDFGS